LRRPKNKPCARGLRIFSDGIAHPAIMRVRNYK
jgi:hypothetical protein